MIWADKIGLAVFALTWIAMYAMCPTHEDFVLLEGFFFRASLFLWVVLRIIDWLTGGSARRKRNRESAAVSHKIIDVTRY